MENEGQKIPKDLTRFWMALEDLFILLSIFALWPTILGWEGFGWEALKYATGEIRKHIERTK